MSHYVFIRKYNSKAAWGGCEKRIFRYFKRTDYSKNSITLLTTHDIFMPEVKIQNIPVKVEQFKLFNGQSGFGNFCYMYKLLRALRPDKVVFVQGSFLDFTFSEFLAAYVCTKGNIFSLEVLGAQLPPAKVSKRYLGIIPGVALWWHKKMYFWSLRGRLCKLILAVGQEVKYRMVQWYRYPADKIITLITAIDTDQFKPDKAIGSAFRARHGIAPDDRVVVSTARLSKQKCIHRLINAFDVVWRENKNIWLILVGDGPLRGDLEGLAASKESHGHIIFVGYQANSSDYLKMGDIFVLASDIEGIATALLEAMANSLVCVATQTPGPNELIQDGQNGFLVEPSDEGVLNGLNKALSLSVQQADRMRENARAFILENYTRIPPDKDAVKLLGLRSENSSDEYKNN